MHAFARLMIVSASILMAACSQEVAPMSFEDFQKPENAAALAATLDKCRLVLPNDPRAANCRVASNAKFALAEADARRHRLENAAARRENATIAKENTTVVPQTSRPATVFSGGDGVIR